MRITKHENDALKYCIPQQQTFEAQNKNKQIK